ncbi:MAG: TraR/DksA family transcriptional regulator, partial [Longimicrobiales bacterium]
MPTLTAEQVVELKAILEKELAGLQRSMRVSEDALKPVELDQAAVGRLSRMDSLQNQGMARNLHEREQVKLAKIETALKRIAAGGYGTCVSCGSDIVYG